MLTPEQIIGYGKKDASEHLHQTAVFAWIALEGVKIEPKMKWAYAVPNGGDRRLSVAASLKAEGVKKGVPDVCWPYPCGLKAGLYIEMKKPGRENETRGGCSPEQVEWLDYLRDNHYHVAVCYGWQQARDMLIAYAKGQF